MIIPFIVFRNGHNKKTVGDIDHRHRLFGEGEMHAVAVEPLKFDHIAGAEIVQGENFASIRPSLSRASNPTRSA